MASSAPPAQERQLAHWVARLNDKDMPAFGYVVRKIASVADGNRASAAELARVVLEDAALTSHVLKLANSPLYNAGRRRISTVSRGVVVLGFDAVRNACLSRSLVENLLQGAQHSRVAQEMARAFHAAVQARAFAVKRNDPAPEEVFIAALLYRLGEMAFWCFGGELTDQAETLIREAGYSEGRAAEAVLGFQPGALTTALSQEWQLSPLLDQVLTGAQAKEPRISNISYAHELVNETERGWDTPEVRDLTLRLAEALYMPSKDVTEMLHANAQQAARTTADYGAQGASELVPLPCANEHTPMQASAETEASQDPFPEADSMLQLHILREIAGLLEEGGDFNLLLEMVLEGMHRGVGLDRVVFALLSRNRRQLTAKYTVGAAAHSLREGFHFDVGEPSTDVLAHVLVHPQPLRAPDELPGDDRRLITPALHELAQGQSFLLAPVVVKQKPIGLFYADRYPSRRELDDETFASFKHFAAQARHGLAYIDQLRASGGSR